MSQAGRFDIGGQDADNIYNVGRDQYYTQILHERQSFLSEIAATKTKARFLVTAGFLMVFLGAVAFAIPLLGELNNLQHLKPSALGFPGPKIGGVSIGIIGFGVGFIGQFILLAGIVLHIVAAARRRRLPDLPPPPPGYSDSPNPRRWDGRRRR
jgi:hypothetical protein